ncbi:hypothetical protein P9D43_22580 [Neobacillus niacini]|uniref:hypothetical protein n=1 Tax=Neobacillus niacini TaxID=86668 RepID=UPI00052FB3E5|nr:hypothetical protein [Neobacillus niacini]KGM45228.1 hypothetical protein NP83_07175 [Neobacillus niacini]MEC1524796.1 hypothetical protein [Neobacillus niacini]
MKLPAGITGFYDLKNNQPPNVDGKQFKQVCSTLVNRSGGKVLEFKEPQYPMNFYDIEVKAFNKHFHILLNEHYPYLAFASVVEFGKINFIDVPELKQFRSLYKVLSVRELNEPLVLNPNSKEGILQNENDLNSAELEQVAYWKPKRIGEVIFNYWD